jgi:quinoprotein glucose dehydrogenase
MTKKKIIIFSIGLLFIFFSYFIIDIKVKKVCRNIPRLLVSIKDLGFGQLYTCKNPTGLKSYLNKRSKYLFDVGSYVKRKYISKSKFNKINFNNLTESEYRKQQEKYFPEFYKNDLYIKGVTSTDFNPISFGPTYKKSINSYRQNKDNINSKFYTNNEITKDNIKNLKLAWKHTDILEKNLKKKWIHNIQITPIYADGKIFYIGANHTFFAMDPKNGKILWSKQLLHQPSRRGFVWDYDENKQKGYIFLPVGRQLFKIDSEDGSLDNEFGKNGYINVAPTKFSPIIFEKNIYYVTRHGSLYAFNKETGIPNLKIKLHPNKNFKGGVPWGGMAFDENKKIAYIVTGNPRPGTYGVKRTGSNKNTNSLIAIDITKKKIIWSFQETSHDLWDVDLAFPPILITLNINNKNYDCILLGSKVGNIILLERYTGKPIFDVEYREAPISKVPNEITSPYQPYFAKPEPITTFDFSSKNLDKLSIDNRKYLESELKNYDHGWYQPPRINVPLVIKLGGPHWEGGSINPLKKKYYTTVNHNPTVIKMFLQSEWPHAKISSKYKNAHKKYLKKCASCHGKNREGYLNRSGGTQVSFKQNVPSLVGFSFYDELKDKLNNYDLFNDKHKKLNINKKDFFEINGLFEHWDNELKKNDSLLIRYNYDYFKTQKNSLPGINPPYGEIVGYDLVSGTIEWRVPFGKVKSNGEELNLGTFNKGGLANTINEIIFATGTFDNKIIALDAKNGNEIWSYQMSAAGSAPPMIFTHDGKDYVSVISTGSNEPLQGDGGGKKIPTSKDSTIYTFSLN